jgi:dienelactone hydrolase
MTESSVRFGPGQTLSGILTEPEGGSAKRTLLLVTAGLIPKHGPFRLYAEIARRLAGEGFASLRFDLGGVGDSRVLNSELPLKLRTELEIRAAADFLCGREKLTHGLAIGGLCSGAEDAFRYAENDPRVAHVFMIDPFAYRTSGWAWRHLLHRAGRWSLRVRGSFQPLPPQKNQLVDYKYMERGESTRVLKATLARRVRLHFIYTGGMRESFNHPAQFPAMFPEVDLGDSVTVDYFPTLEHTQLLLEDRRLVVETIASRLGGPSRAT